MHKLFTSIVLFFLLATSSVVGQNDSPKIKVWFVNGYWMVDFKASNQQAMLALEKSIPGFNPSNLGVEGLEKKYKKYLIERFELKVDSSIIPVKHVSTEMNSARANVQFISARFETHGETITIKSRAYADIEDKPVKLVVDVDDQKHVHWLTEDNGFEIKLELDAQTSQE